MANEDPISRYRANLDEEQDSAYLYRVLADVEPDERLSGVYRRFWQRPRRSTSGSGSRRSGRPAIATSVLASAAGLFGLGAAPRVFTGRSVLLAGSRQVLVGAAAATLTYVLGAILGTSVGG
jgi:hypothetical protein